jgi:uncharacterized protein YcaQ
LKITPFAAKTLALVKQGLAHRRQANDKEAILQTVRRLGYVQVDTINVVARSHYFTLLSRHGLYRRKDLDDLLYNPDGRRLFEYWGHAASILPLEDYGYYLARMAWHRDVGSPRAQEWREQNQQVIADVLAEVRQRGPLGSRDFADPRDRRGTWWDWKPAKRALDHLWTTGYLMVSQRVNFQKIYDLTERVLPAWVDRTPPTEEERLRYFVLRAVGAMGIVFRPNTAALYFTLRRQSRAVQALMQTLLDEGLLAAVEVEGLTDPGVVLSEDLPLLKQIVAGEICPDRTTFLSPFDNLIWDRQHLQHLWNFEYSLEAYTPAAKRRWGYFCLPILRRGSLVGRIDPKMDRQTGTMIWRAAYLENDVALDDALLDDLAEATGEFMTFHNAQALVITQSQPAELAPALTSRLE